jgi:mannose-6-phosphate isomerase-like protein (cupin superfamily)
MRRSQQRQLSLPPSIPRSPTRLSLSGAPQRSSSIGAGSSPTRIVDSSPVRRQPTPNRRLDFGSSDNSTSLFGSPQLVQKPPHGPAVNGKSTSASAPVVKGRGSSGKSSTNAAGAKNTKKRSVHDEEVPEEDKPVRLQSSSPVTKRRKAGLISRKPGAFTVPLTFDPDTSVNSIEDNTKESIPDEVAQALSDSEREEDKEMPDTTQDMTGELGDETEMDESMMREPEPEVETDKPKKSLKPQKASNLMFELDGSDNEDVETKSKSRSGNLVVGNQSTKSASANKPQPAKPKAETGEEPGKRKGKLVLTKTASKMRPFSESSTDEVDEPLRKKRGLKQVLAKKTPRAATPISESDIEEEEPQPQPKKHRLKQAPTKSTKTSKALALYPESDTEEEEEPVPKKRGLKQAPAKKVPKAASPGPESDIEEPEPRPKKRGGKTVLVKRATMPVAAVTESDTEEDEEEEAEPLPKKGRGKPVPAKRAIAAISELESGEEEEEQEAPPPKKREGKELPVKKGSKVVARVLESEPEEEEVPQPQPTKHGRKPALAKTAIASISESESEEEEKETTQPISRGGKKRGRKPLSSKKAQPESEQVKEAIEAEAKQMPQRLGKQSTIKNIKPVGWAAKAAKAAKVAKATNQAVEPETEDETEDETEPDKLLEAEIPRSKANRKNIAKGIPLRTSSSGKLSHKSTVAEGASPQATKRSTRTAANLKKADNAPSKSTSGAVKNKAGQRSKHFTESHDIPDASIDSELSQDEGRPTKKPRQSPIKPPNQSKGKSKGRTAAAATKSKNATLSQAQSENGKQRAHLGLVGVRGNQRIVKETISNNKALVDDGKRRSVRHRIAPLQFWKNEKVQYVLTRDHRRKSGIAMPEMVSVVRVESDDEIVKPRSKRTTAATAKSKARAKGSSERGDNSKRILPGHASDVESEDDPGDLEAWEKDTGAQNPGVKMGIVKTYPPSYDEDGAEEFAEAQLAFSRDHIVTVDVAHSTFKFIKTYTEGTFGTGVIDIPPGGMKRMKHAGGNVLVFFLVKGRVTAQIGENRFRVGKGGQIMIPRGKFSLFSLSVDFMY